MRQLTEHVMEELLAQYEGVIYAALKSIHLYKSNQRFDDFYQLGCIKLFEAYESCVKDPLEEENRYQFVSFAQQRIRWAFLDEIRKEKRISDHEEFGDENEATYGTISNEFENHIFLEDTLKQLNQHLTEREKAFLEDRLYYNMNMSAIAKKHGVSRKTVHTWRNKVKDKAEKILFLKEV